MDILLTVLALGRGCPTLISFLRNFVLMTYAPKIPSNLIELILSIVTIAVGWEVVLRASFDLYRLVVSPAITNVAELT